MDAWQFLWEYYLRTDLLIVQLPVAGPTDGILPLAVSFSCFLGGLVWLPGPSGVQGSLEHFQPLRRHSRPPGKWVYHFQGRLRQCKCTTEVRDLQCHVKKGCSDSHCTMPPADFNRCPPSFRRDHYQHSTAPMVTTLLFHLLLYQGAAPAGWASLAITNLLMGLDVLTVQIRPCSHGAHWEELSFSNYPLEKGQTESNLLPYKNCTLFWKSKCKLFINFVTISKGRGKQ